MRRCAVHWWKRGLARITSNMCTVVIFVPLMRLLVVTHSLHPAQRVSCNLKTQLAARQTSINNCLVWHAHTSSNWLPVAAPLHTILLRRSQQPQ